ncbi:MAG: serine hydrolase [Pseudomonadota bacterium]
MKRPDALSLANWREAPTSHWAFQHIDQILPCASVVVADNPCELSSAAIDLGDVVFEGINGVNWTLDALLDRTSTDALFVAHQGTLVCQRSSGDYDVNNPHIVFSVSKSLTAIVAGVLVDSGQLDTSRRITHYVPEVSHSAYGDCSVQHVLDMTVSTAFEEDYTATQGDYIHYRKATGWNPVDDGEASVGLHTFLESVAPGTDPHGMRFRYRSPNSDLLGWVLERASGVPLAELFSQYLWQPIGASSNAVLTVDALGAGRSAGGFCATPADLVKVGEMVRLRGTFNNTQIVSEKWVSDCATGGDINAWDRGDLCLFLPRGCYRNQWYRIDRDKSAFCAIGIHGQWLYIDPHAEVVIVKLSSQSVPVDELIDRATIRAFESVCDFLTQ